MLTYASPLHVDAEDHSLSLWHYGYGQCAFLSVVHRVGSVFACVDHIHFSCFRLAHVTATLFFGAFGAGTYLREDYCDVRKLEEGVWADAFDGSQSQNCDTECPSREGGTTQGRRRRTEFCVMDNST